ncbi:MAG: hypothetical protein WCF23_23055 [Candidatus Nitrosopolaris sp.]
MGRAPAKAANERRQRVWFLMLKGHNPQSITQALNVCNATVYKDIKFLTKKSQKYIYDMAKGTHVLLYQRAIEGISLTLASAWDKFNDPMVPEKQKLGYLALTKACNESMINLTANGASVLAIQDITNRARRLGIDNSQQQTEIEKADLNYNTNESEIS